MNSGTTTDWKVENRVIKCQMTNSIKQPIVLKMKVMNRGKQHSKRKEVEKLNFTAKDLWKIQILNLPSGKHLGKHQEAETETVYKYKNLGETAER